MKKIPYIIIVVLVIVISVLSYRSCSHTPNDISGESVISRDTIVDTIPYYYPVPKDSTIVKWETKVVPVFDTISARRDTLTTPAVIISENKDSADIYIPITQKVYEDSTYRAYVSGYAPALDSIFIYRPTERIYIRSPTKVKRFSVGLQCGYGMTPKGFQPYIGVGISVNLISF